MKGQKKRRKNGFKWGNSMNKLRNVTDSGNSSVDNGHISKNYVRLPRDLHEKVFRGTIEEQIRRAPNVTGLRPTPARLNDAQLLASAGNSG